MTGDLAPWYLPMPFPGVAKGKQLSSPTRQARVLGALQWWRLQEARGPSPGRTGLPQDLPRSQQLWRLCLPSAGPPPGLQPHLRVLTQPGATPGPVSSCLPHLLQ